MKLIDASEVIEGKIKKKPIKKIEDIIKSGGIKLVEPSKVSINGTKNTEAILGSSEYEDKSGGKSLGRSGDNSGGKINRMVRTIKLRQDVYYGPKNVNKNKFMRMYKKLGLVWKTDNIDGVIVDGWINKDKSQYIIKLPEEGDFKRFTFYGCDEIYDFFINLGAISFELSDKEEKDREKDKVDISGTCESNIDSQEEKYEFIGADLWSGYKTRKLLKKMPDNWGVIWK